MRPAAPTSLRQADRHGTAQSGAATGRGFGVYRTPSGEIQATQGNGFIRRCATRCNTEPLGVAVAQSAEPRDVTPVDVDSNSTGHPQGLWRHRMSKPRFVSSVEERPPVERNVSGSNPLRGATNTTPQCRVAQRESRRSITARSSVRSGPRQPVLLFMRPWRNRDTRESQKLVSTVACRFDPCRAHHISTPRFARQRLNTRGRNSADQSTRLLTGESMGSNPSARTSTDALHIITLGP